MFNLLCSVLLREKDLKQISILFQTVQKMSTDVIKNWPKIDPKVETVQLTENSLDINEMDKNKIFDSSTKDEQEALPKNKVLPIDTGPEIKIETPSNLDTLHATVIENDLNLSAKDRQIKKEQNQETCTMETVLQNNSDRHLEDKVVETAVMLGVETAVVSSVETAVVSGNTTSCRTDHVDIEESPTLQRKDKPSDQNIDTNSTGICRSILESLISRTDFEQKQETPVLLIADSDEEMTDAIETVDPLSLSDNESSNKNIEAPSPCSTITILSSDSEEEEKPLATKVRQKCSKRGRPIKSETPKELSQFKKNIKEFEEVRI